MTNENERMMATGETARTHHGGGAEGVTLGFEENLSGKRTFAGRDSGEHSAIARDGGGITHGET